MDDDFGYLSSSEHENNLPYIPLICSIIICDEISRDFVADKIAMMVAEYVDDLSRIFSQIFILIFED